MESWQDRCTRTLYEWVHKLVSFMVWAVAAQKAHVTLRMSHEQKSESQCGQTCTHPAGDIS